MNGTDALEMVDENPPDLILLDIMMPGMDGYEVCERLKSDPETMHIPIVMVTALTDASDRVKGLEAGADDFISKPINDTALLSRVRSLVRLKMTIDEWRMREDTASDFGVISDQALEMAESGRSGHILLVEDNVTEAEKITKNLKLDDHSVHHAINMADAMAIAGSTPLDLAIIDLTVSSMDAMRVCSNIRLNESTKDTPILLIAEESDMTKVATGLEFGGAHDYVIRPIDQAELRARVRTQIRRHRYQRQLRSNYEEGLANAVVDQLTGLFNRRYLIHHAKKILANMRKTGKPVCVLILDIDDFKQVNDTYGHLVGDQILKQLATRLKRDLRSFDLFARYGGEEFVIVLPDLNPDYADGVAERLRKTVADHPFDVDHQEVDELSITISIGGTVVTPENEKVTDTIIERADKMLYKAKEAGKNTYFFDNLDTVK
jgi:two-component system cell cycle response regulator